jgi:hypothetical protein
VASGWGKFLIAGGVVMIATGVIVTLDWHKHLPLGRLPGDIHIKNENSSFYFPITTCILLSVIFSLVSFLLQKWK